LVEKIASLKDEILMQAEQEMHDTGQVNPESIDAVKDLAEAEKACWEAEYYRTVTEAMEDGKSGYDDGMGYSRRGGMGYDRQGRGYRRGYERESRRGYRGQSRDSMGRYTSRRGYRRMDGYGHTDMMAEVRQMMETADPQEREQLKMQLRQMMTEM
jgi:hypothetical protein